MTILALFLYSLIAKFTSSPSDSSCKACVDGKKNETSALIQARSLNAPVPISSLGGEYEDYEWWEDHQNILAEARKEWGRRHPDLYETTSKDFEKRFINQEFRNAIHNAKKKSSPENEAAVLSLCSETNAPGVYAFRLFTQEFIDMLLEELEYQESSGIPMRRPNGMNRYGAILAELQMGSLLEHLTDQYFGYMGTLLFPRSVGPYDAKENYSFVVRYKKGEDVELAEHADASTVTVNVCLGKDGFEGGSLYFKGVRFSETSDQEDRNEIEMHAGMGIIHLGGHIHAALPLTRGERINMIVWMFGENGYVRTAPYSDKEVVEFEETRWLHNEL